MDKPDLDAIEKRLDISEGDGELYLADSVMFDMRYLITYCQQQEAENADLRISVQALEFQKETLERVDKSLRDEVEAANKEMLLQIAEKDRATSLVATQLEAIKALREALRNLINCKIVLGIAAHIRDNARQNDIPDALLEAEKTLNVR